MKRPLRPHSPLFRRGERPLNGEWNKRQCVVLPILFLRWHFSGSKRRAATKLSTSTECELLFSIFRIPVFAYSHFTEPVFLVDLTQVQADLCCVKAVYLSCDTLSYSTLEKEHLAKFTSISGNIHLAKVLSLLRQPMF